MELAIDTSTRVAGVALAHRGETLAELTWKAEFKHTAQHTTQLTPAIDYLLRQQGVKPAQLEAVIIAKGPGSFSGLRVGVSAAKGFALALDLPLIGVGTLLVAAYPFLGARLPVQPVLDAGRGELITARFEEAGGEPVETSPAAIVTLAELCAPTGEAVFFCGEHLPAVRDAIAQRRGALALFPPMSALMRRPGNLAELGWRRLSRGEADDAATLQPVYIRDPSITRPRPVTARR